MHPTTLYPPPTMIQARRNEAPRLDRDDVQLLRALADGHSTTSAAHALGYSERTARRKLAAICDLLGVKSVTAAAVLAVRRGII